MRSKNLFYLISDLVSDCYQSGTWQGSHGYQFFTGKVSFVNKLNSSQPIRLLADINLVEPGLQDLPFGHQA